MTTRSSGLDQLGPKWAQLSDSPPLTDEQLRAQLLEAGRQQLSQSGVTVTLNGLNLDELALAAGVPAVNHLWPTRDAFLADLLIEVVRPTESQGASFDPETLEIARGVVAARAGELTTKAGREAVLMEAIRHGARRNYEYVSTSIQWRTFMALIVSAPGLKDPHRERIFAALKQAEDRFIDRMTAFYDEMLPVFGATPLSGLTTRHIAAVGAAVVEGLAARSVVNEQLVGTPITLRLSTDSEDWHLSAVGFAGVIRGMIELAE